MYIYLDFCLYIDTSKLIFQIIVFCLLVLFKHLIQMNLLIAGLY